LKRTLIFHIGAHRTATSALQAYLQKNHKNLVREGFLYPLNVRRHINFINALFDKKRDISRAVEILNERANRPSREIHTIILSDEDICMRPDLSLLAQFRDYFDVKLVFTLRRQDSWLESWFFQNIKWQWNKKLSHCTFDEFIAMREDFHWIHYDRYVRHLEALFGQNNIILNIHEKEQMQGGPIETFCNSIGLTKRHEFTDPIHMNASFSPVISEFMRQLPLDKASVEYRNMLAGACANIDKALHGETKKQSERLLPYDQRVNLMKTYASGNRALAQRYFDRDELFLDPLPAPDAQLAKMALPSDTTELMKNYVAPLLTAIIAKDKEQKRTEGKD